MKDNNDIATISKAVRLNLAKEVLNTLLSRKDVNPSDPKTADIAVAHANSLVTKVAEYPEHNH